MSVVTFTTSILQIHTPLNTQPACQLPRGSALWSGIHDGGCLDAEIFNSLTPSLAQCDSCQTWQHKGALDSEYEDIAAEVSGCWCFDTVIGFLILLFRHFSCITGNQKPHPSSDSSWTEECIMSGRKTH